MFRKILIANRGEIACRVVSTARRLGIGTVAVYSEADIGARHTRLADEAWPIGPAPSRQSYLAIEKMIDVARRSGCEAVHPGYGFLSENPDFAAACAAAGLVFVGPPVDAIRAMGSKAESKALMERSGVPLVPGYHGEEQDIAVLSKAAARIGYPVLIKASAGGGGKGMRIVRSADEFAAAVEGARREAATSFGDDRLLVEKYLQKPRHIEIQIFADSHGTILSLFERDCSIQRRHQKVLEEAPAPGMSPERRKAMSAAAVAAARAVGYVGAGTVEFIVEDDAFFFMEMNTRLQVEHPVTEMVTGQDLVEWQLRVAAGERLPLAEDALAIRGHAIEARIYAEDPARDFLPSVGTLAHLRQPSDIAGIVRVDTGVVEGDRITPDYDPMIAKLIVWGEDRDAAVQRLQAALGDYEIVGPATNIDFLRAIAGHPAFGDADLDTGFIARNAQDLMPAGEAGRPEPAAWAAAALSMLQGRRVAPVAEERWSPWLAGDAWRMNRAGYEDVVLRHGDTEAVTVRAHPHPDGSYTLDLPDGRVRATLAVDGRGSRIAVDGVGRDCRVVRRGCEFAVLTKARADYFHYVDPYAARRGEGASDDRVAAPIPGRVAHVLVAPGEMVAKDAPLVVIEAMKMELTLSAPVAGRVAAVNCAVEDFIEGGAELVVIDAEGEGEHPGKAG